MKGKTMDNRGSSLIHVIICVIFISMLGMLLLAATFLNVRLKQMEQKKQENFYECETAINEIATGIYHAVIDSVQESYIRVLGVYATDSYQTVDGQLKQNDLINYYYRECVNAFEANLGLSACVGTQSQQLQEKMTGYLVSNLGFATVGEGCSFQRKSTQSGAILEQYVVLQSVEVHYEKGEQSTSISTDLTIRFPSIDIEAIGEVSTSFTLPYQKYAIVAEGGIRCKDGISNVVGNLYAGENGILAANDSTKLFLYGDEYLLKGDLVSKDRARIQVGAFEQKASLWAKNIKTESTTENTKSSTTLILDGKGRYTSEDFGVNCYIADDMKLDAVYSDVTLMGDYIGYGTVAEAAPEESGSSIVVNGNQSSLIINGNTLALGGYAYIGFKQNRLSNENSFTFDSNSMEEIPLILTGESIGIKSNQLLYLVPNVYMVTKSNPIPYTEYISYGGIDLVSIDAMKAENPNITIQPVVYTTMAGADQVVYFYVSFQNAGDAIDFFHQCMNDVDWYKVGERVFHLKQVTLNLSNIYSAGNVLDYQIDASGNLSQDELVTQAFTSLVSFDGMEISHLTNYYDTLTKVLKKELDEGEVITMLTTPFSYYMNTGRIATEYNKQQVNGADYAYNHLMLSDYTFVEPGTESQYKAHIVVTNGDYVVTGSRDKGMIIANGDVTVKADFEGLIFCNGTVLIGNSANVIYNEELVKDILLHCDSDLRAYFQGVDVLDELTVSKRNNETPEILLEDLITYSNWKKY